MYLALVFFLWGCCSQPCERSKPQSTRVIPSRACRHDCERCCALEAIRYKSCSYGLLLTIYGVLCASSLSYNIMSLFWFIRREELVRLLASRMTREVPLRQARWMVTGKFFRTNQRKRISTESPKRCFLMRPMSLTSIEITCFLLISLDLLSLIFVLIHDRSRSGTEELFFLWCMGATRLTERASSTLRKAIAYHSYAKRSRLQRANGRLDLQTIYILQPQHWRTRRNWHHLLREVSPQWHPRQLVRKEQM